MSLQVTCTSCRAVYPWEKMRGRPELCECGRDLWATGSMAPSLTEPVSLAEIRKVATLRQPERQKYNGLPFKIVPTSGQDTLEIGSAHVGVEFPTREYRDHFFMEPDEVVIKFEVRCSRGDTTYTKIQEAADAVAAKADALAH